MEGWILARVRVSNGQRRGCDWKVSIKDVARRSIVFGIRCTSSSGTTQSMLKPKLYIPAVTAASNARSFKNCFGLITGRRSLRARRTGLLFQIFLQTTWEIWRKKTTWAPCSIECIAASENQPLCSATLQRSSGVTTRKRCLR